MKKQQFLISLRYNKSVINKAFKALESQIFHESFDPGSGQTLATSP